MKTPILKNAAVLPLLAALVGLNTAQASLVQWFKLDEGAVDATTNTVYSSSSSATGTTNGNSGTGNLGWATTGLAPVALMPPTDSTRGTVAALSLSGTNAIRTTAVGVLGASSVPRSVAAWIKVVGTPLANATIVGWGPNVNGARFDLRISKPGSVWVPRIEVNGSSIEGAKNVGDGNWHHVAVSYASGANNTRIYADGVLDVSGALTLVAATTLTNILIGDSWSDPTTRKFKGQIDDVRVYDHALSQNEVQALALSPAITNLMASQTNVTGNATFNSGITAFGTGLTGLTNQWSLDGVDQAGQTSGSYSVTGASVGTHAIAVRSGNAYGMVTNSTTVVVQVPSAVITAPSAFPASVSTTYGTASPSTNVAVSGSALSGDITATAPTGFEVSNDGTTWGSTTAFTQSGGNAGGTLYVRIKNNAPVAGSYNSANVVLSSLGATSVSVASFASGNTVSPKALNVISATALDKMYDGTTDGTVLGTLDAGEAFGAGNSADGKPYTGDALSVSAPGTFASSAVGTGISVTAGTFTLSGAAAGNYTVNQPVLSLSAAIRDTAVWVQLTGGSWTNINNWQNGVIGGGTGNSADFTTLTLTGARTVTLDGPRTIGNLWFGDQSTNNYGWTLNAGSGGPLTLAVTSGTPAISNSVFTTITVQLAGSQGLSKTGNGTLRLNNTANPITGEILVNAGVLQMRDGTVNSPTVFAAATMDQRSLRITGTGVEELFRSSTGAETVTWALPATTLENGGTLRCRNGNDFAYTHNVDSALTIGSGGGVIASTGPTKNQTIALSGALSGSGALAFAAQDAGSSFLRRLAISSPNNTYSGNWTVSQSGAGTANLRAGAANALGTGTVTLGTRATLENNAPSGLDSLAGVTLNETSSTLDLSANPWNGASAILTAKNGTNNLGAATSTVGTFVLDSTNTVTLNGSGGSLAATVFDIRQGTLGGTGSLTGSGTLTKTTSGLTTLAGSYTYTGATIVSNGTLLVNGTLDAGSAVTVNGGTLGGTGTIGGTVIVNNGGTLSPGASIGTLTINNTLTLNANSTLRMEINRTNAQTSDQVLGLTSLTVGGTLRVDNLGETLQRGDSFSLFNVAPGGAFATTNLPALDPALNWYTPDNFKTLVVNGMPTGHDVVLGAQSGVPATVQIIAGKPRIAPADPDNDPLSVTGVGGAANGSTSTDGSNVTYTANATFAGTNTFSYTVSDGRGGTATGTVTVIVNAAGGGFNRLAIDTTSIPGRAILTYAGIPNFRYALEWTHDLTAPVTWSPVVTNQAAGDGMLLFTNTASGGADFYRTTFVSGP